MLLIAEDEMQREYSRLRRQRRGVGRRGDDEIDIAGAELLQHHRLLAELRAGELIDAQLAAAQFLQLGVKDIARDAVGGRLGLVIAEGEFALRIRAARHNKRRGSQGQCGNRDPSAVHPVPPCFPAHFELRRIVAYANMFAQRNIGNARGEVRFAPTAHRELTTPWLLWSQSLTRPRLSSTSTSSRRTSSGRRTRSRAMASTIVRTSRR